MQYGRCRETYTRRGRRGSGPIVGATLSLCVSETVTKLTCVFVLTAGGLGFPCKKTCQCVAAVKNEGGSHWAAGEAAG